MGSARHHLGDPALDDGQRAVQQRYAGRATSVADAAELVRASGAAESSGQLAWVFGEDIDREHSGACHHVLRSAGRVQACQQHRGIHRQR